MAGTPVFYSGYRNTINRLWGQLSAQCWETARGFGNTAKPAAEQPPMGHRASCRSSALREVWWERHLHTVAALILTQPFGKRMAFYSLRQECWQPGREELAFDVCYRGPDGGRGRRKAVFVDG